MQRIIFSSTTVPFSYDGSAGAPGSRVRFQSEMFLFPMKFASCRVLRVTLVDKVVKVFPAQRVSEMLIIKEMIIIQFYLNRSTGPLGQPGLPGQLFARGQRGEVGESGPPGKTGRPGIPGPPGDDAPYVLVTPGAVGIKGYPGDAG